MNYLHEDFLLSTKTGQRLYHEVAAEQPIIDYHCHLPPEAVARDDRFPDLAEIWLGGDHYKWRAMRAAGVPESLITGKDTDPWEKFRAWAGVVPQTVRNPLHHWAHLELKRYFNCDLILNEANAEKIWKTANEQLAGPEFTTRKILERFNIRALGTTDDPVDNLEHHISFNKENHSCKMYPTYRPDKAMKTENPAAWKEWLGQLEAVADRSIESAGDLREALKQRHDFFHEAGCRASDHGMETCPYAECSDGDAEKIFKQLLKGKTLEEGETRQWMTWILQNVGRWNAERGWAMQFHLGALRSANTRMFEKLGPDTGFDSSLDEPLVRPLAAFLDSLDREERLPKCVFYHVSPSYLHPLATLMGSFQDGSVPGKMQLGSAWWHIDTIDGMRTQMEVLSSVGLLARFIGMLTDSRSFLSFPRHEYFRRLLCDIVGADVDAGLIPDDREFLDQMIRDICFENARNYLNFPGV